MRKSTFKKVQKIKKTKGIPLAVFTVTGGVCALERLNSKTSNSLFLSWSVDGLSFDSDSRKVNINISTTKKEKIQDCDNFVVSPLSGGFIMTYVRKSRLKNKDVVVIAKSRDLYEWTVKSEIIRGDTNHSVLLYSKELDLFFLYRDGLFVKNQTARTLVSWREKPSLIFTSRNGMFDSDTVSLVGGVETKEGFLLIYNASIKKEEQHLLQAGGVLFDIKNPKHILWRSEAPLWQGVVETKNKNESIVPVGFIHFGGQFIIYWATKNGGMVISTFPSLFKNTEIYQHKILKRYENNPIITARKDHDWEILGTFNPTVFQDENNVLHMFYRALGLDGISRVGYAQSFDGITISKRLPHPIFEPSPGFGLPDPTKAEGPTNYCPAYYTSGGGWGGSEDPRVVKIDDKIYMIYVAFEGWNSIRIALTNISVDDFKRGKWNWKKPILLSPLGEIHKNWVLFPEKINGKFAILHGISPEILIDYIESFDSFDGSVFIKSSPPKGGREKHWDNKMRGAGPSPIKTDLGWLLLYHAQNKKEPHKYKLGAMILDLNDPTKILYRSFHPILSPDMHYENDGKPGVIYASGAIIRGDDLYVYYGGGDKVVCVASTPLKKFLDYLVTGNAESYELKKVI
jgi:predicted GH43/DUF377 family glycosyl hydrolase